MKTLTDDSESQEERVGELSGAISELRPLRRPIPGLRWWIIGLVFLATAINYVNRQSLSLLFPVFSKPDELNISALQYSQISTVLLLAYMISQSVSGKFYDRYGSKIGFIVSIIIWSLASMGESLMVGFASFATLAFFLGFGEAGNWPGAAKVVAEWFPARERALGMAIFNSGAAMGSVIAPPLVVWLQLTFGWRPTLLVVGALGFVWLAMWVFAFHTPERHPHITAEELTYIQEGQAPATAVGKRERAIRWSTLLQYRKVWAVVVARVLVDPIWWLFVLWLPDYLNKARGMSLKQIGMFAWVPYLAAAAGSLFGGWLAGRLIARGMGVSKARKTVVGLAACLMPFGILAAYATTPTMALVFISIVLFGFQMWISNVQTLPSDLFPGSAVGSVAGLAGTGAAIGSMAFMLTTGWIVTNFSYAPVLIISGLLAPIGTVALFSLIGRIERVALPLVRES